MKLLIVGDFKTNTGPASVNKCLRKVTESTSTIDYLTDTNNLMRLLKLFYSIRKYDYVLFSGLSKINIIGFKIAKINHIEATYLAHGSVYYENKLNNIIDNKTEILEKKVLYNAPKIICVSKKFMLLMQSLYPDISDKFFYANNGVYWNELTDNNNKSQVDENLIISVGGGMPRKNILTLCESIQYLNFKKKMNLKLMVIGPVGEHSEQIRSFEFVEYIEKVSKMI